MREKENDKDLSAALLPGDGLASPATTEALPKCPNTKTCTEPCEDVDGLDYCLKCGLWKGAR